MKLSFTVHAAPVPKSRPRVMTGYTFTPKRVRDFEKLVALKALEVKPLGWPMQAEYRVRIAVYRARRAGDIDNLGKTALDGCNRILWDDDRRISDLHIMRFDGEEPRLFVEVEAA